MEEEVARDFLCFGRPDATIAVTDVARLERNLNLVLQMAEITPRIVVCVNFMDEARRKKLDVNVQTLSRELGLPVVPMAANRGEGLSTLKQTVHDIAFGVVRREPRKISYSDRVETLVSRIEPSLETLLLGHLNARWVALRLLDGDTTILTGIERNLCPGITKTLQVRLKHELEFNSI